MIFCSINIPVVGGQISIQHYYMFSSNVDVSDKSINNCCKVYPVIKVNPLWMHIIERLSSMTL